MSTKEDIADIIAKRNKLQEFIKLNDRLKAESQNHKVDMTVYTITQKLIHILNNKIMILNSLDSVYKSEPTIKVEKTKPIERAAKANTIQIKNNPYFENSKNTLIETQPNVVNTSNKNFKSEPTIKIEKTKPIERAAKANTIDNILAIQLKNKTYFENSKNTLIETQTNVVNTLNKLINIQPNKIFKSKLIAKVTQTAANYLKIQNNIEISINKFIELQKKAIYSIAFNKDNNTQKNANESCMKHFYELKIFIIKCTSESRQVFQMLSVRLNNKIYQESIKPETIKHEVIKQEVIKQANIKQELIKQEAIKQANIKQESIRQESIKQESIRQESIRQESIRQANAIKQESIRQANVIKQESIRQESIRQESIRQESIRQANIKQEAIKRSIEKDAILVVRSTHNHSENIEVDEYPLDFSNLSRVSDDTLIKINNNIKNFTKYIDRYRNILFICGDYPGYGGAATNCFRLSKYLENNGHNTYSIFFNYEVECDIKFGHFSNYCIINSSEFKTTVSNLSFKPDLIILKSPMAINIKTLINNCPIYYLIGGIYLNDLDKNYNLLNDKIEQDKYINKGVLLQITYCDKSFCNSLHTHEILKKYYKIKTDLFYSSFIQYYNEIKIDNIDFEKRKYQYGLIVSNFNRKIKNVEKSIHFLKDKQNVILIGKGSSKYKSYGFECVELVENDKMTNYYKEIKYIVQDSFYESCSNVKVEGLMNGCMISFDIVISSTQYPGYGGAATNAYQLIKYFRQNGVNAAGVFFHNRLDVNYDPEGYGGIFLYHTTKYNEDMIRRDVKSYLKTDPKCCLGKNYLAPILCKQIFKCYTVYLVSGINHFNYYTGKSACDILSTDFIIKVNVLAEIKCNNLCDKIVLNSKLCYDIFNKIYPTFKHKIYPSVIDTTSCSNTHDEFLGNLKTFDIAIACSRLDRVDKNNLFLIKILKNPIFNKYRKIIIGYNFDKFINIPNTQCVGFCDQLKCVEYLSKSKVLLFSSLFDSNSNTIREAIYYKCLPIITKNIGGNEAFPDFLICNSFDVNEWTTKLEFVLENYFSLKDTRFNFYKNKNMIDSLLQI